MTHDRCAEKIHDARYEVDRLNSVIAQDAAMIRGLMARLSAWEAIGAAFLRVEDRNDLTRLTHEVRMLLDGPARAGRRA